MGNKKKILIFVDWFYPGFKAGGPIQSCSNLVLNLKDDFEFYIFTSDRDLGDERSYENVIVNKWGSYFSIPVFYATPAFCSFKNISKVIKDINPDVLYMNSMFSRSFTLKPLLISLYSNQSKVILAPRGMLHKGALKVRRTRKLFFLNVFRVLQLAHKIHFHATDQQEANDIKKLLAPKLSTIIATNFPKTSAGEYLDLEKINGTLRIVFVSRVNQKKNLLFFIELLTRIKSNVQFDIFGNIEDANYHEKCIDVIDRLPKNIKVEFKGAISNDKVLATIAGYHLFVLPTLGENFGHSIFEAFLAGRPVLISDQTPWGDLQGKNIGWDIPLHAPEQFVAALEEAAMWTQEQFDSITVSSRNFAKDYLANSTVREQYLKLFS